jgi:hypothetical protein
MWLRVMISYGFPNALIGWNGEYMHSSSTVLMKIRDTSGLWWQRWISSTPILELIHYCHSNWEYVILFSNKLKIVFKIIIILTCHHEMNKLSTWDQFKLYHIYMCLLWEFNQTYCWNDNIFSLFGENSIGECHCSLLSL